MLTTRPTRQHLPFIKISFRLTSGKKVNKHLKFPRDNGTTGTTLKYTRKPYELSKMYIAKQTMCTRWQFASNFALPVYHKIFTPHEIVNFAIRRNILICPPLAPLYSSFPLAEAQTPIYLNHRLSDKNRLFSTNFL